MKSEKVMALYKRKKELQEQIMYWEKFQGVNWLGKWGRSVRLEVLKNKKSQQYKLAKKYFEFLGKRTHLSDDKRYKMVFVF